MSCQLIMKAPSPSGYFAKNMLKKKAISKDFDFEDLQNPKEHYTFASSKEKELENCRLPIARNDRSNPNSLSNRNNRSSQNTPSTQNNQSNPTTPLTVKP